MTARDRLKAIGFYTVVAVVLLLFAWPPYFSGRVVDRSGAPVSDAFIIVSWDGQALPIGHGVNRHCYRAVITTTNPQGRYRVVDLWFNPSPLLVVRDAGVSVYKPGYREVASDAPRSDTLLLEPVDPDKPPRDLRWLDNVLGCGVDDPAFMPAIKARYNEARATARSDEDRKHVDALLFTVERLELGEEVANRNYGERIRAQAIAERARMEQPKPPPALGPMLPFPGARDIDELRAMKKALDAQPARRKPPTP